MLTEHYVDVAMSHFLDDAGERVPLAHLKPGIYWRGDRGCARVRVLAIKRTSQSTTVVSDAEDTTLEELRALELYPTQTPLEALVASMTLVSEQSPPPHALYLVRRNGKLHTCTVCYGMHAPWWIVHHLDSSEAEPLGMQPDDRWLEIPRHDPRTATPEGSD